MEEHATPHPAPLGATPKSTKSVATPGSGVRRRRFGSPKPGASKSDEASPPPPALAQYVSAAPDQGSGTFDASLTHAELSLADDALIPHRGQPSGPSGSRPGGGGAASTTLEDLLLRAPLSPSPDDPGYEMSAATPNTNDNDSPLNGGGSAASASPSRGVQPSEQSTPPRRTSSGSFAGSPANALRTRRSVPAPENYNPGEPIPSQATVDVPADLRCPICMDAFDAPVTLRCYHSVCKAHILDLAAARTKAKDAPPGSVVVDCPKCRETTRFDSREDIKVNHEMNAIVDVLLGMLRSKAATAAQSKPTPPSTPPAQQSSSALPPKTPTSGKPAVRFALGGSPSSAAPPDASPAPPGTGSPADARAPLRPALKRHATPQQHQPQPDDPAFADAPGPRAKAARTINQLSHLEQRLAEKREAMVREREERKAQAVAEFKQMRMAEIQARQAALQAIEGSSGRASTASPAGFDMANDPLTRKPLALRLRDGDPVSDSERATLDTTVDTRWKAQEAAFQEAKRHREQQKEQERFAREADVRRAVDDWMEEGRRPATVDAEAETNDFARRLQQALGGAAGPLTASVTRDAMRQAAEARLPPLPPKEERPPPRVPTPPPPRDVEVELRLLEVERAVQREIDDELSREQMAEIAERRARSEVERFRRQERAKQGWIRDARPGTSSSSSALGSSSHEGGGPPVRAGPPPTYTPKLNRLQRRV